MEKEKQLNQQPEEMEESKEPRLRERKHFRPFFIVRILRGIIRTALIFSLGVFVGVHRKAIIRAFIRSRRAALIFGKKNRGGRSGVRSRLAGSADSRSKSRGSYNKLGSLAKTGLIAGAAVKAGKIKRQKKG